MTEPGMLDILILLSRLILAVVFGVAAIAKFYDRPGTEKALRDFGMPGMSVRFGALALPILEIFSALLLIAPMTAWYGGFFSLALLTLFSAAIVWVISQGKRTECHCFGQVSSKPVGWLSLARNLVFLILAAVIVANMTRATFIYLMQLMNDAMGSGEALAYVMGFGGLIFLGVIIHYLRRFVYAQSELLEELQTRRPDNGESKHRHHEHMTSPDEGLPIGAPVPDFELPDMQGRAVSFEQLLMRGKPMLFFFISPTCAPCKALLPEIGKWQEEFAGKVEFIFVSTGSAEENGAKLPQLGGQIHLLQKKREVAELFKAKWTPTAVLANSLGEIAGRPAAGDTAIRGLFELIKEKQPENLDFVENGRGMSPNELKIGAAVPEFELPDVSGKIFSENVFKDKRTLALFWGLDCPHCKRMLPEIKDWETAGANEVGLIIFSSGDVEENRALGLKAPLLIDEGNKIGAEMGMSGTPSAVLVDESGKIVSETAVGAEQIWALVGKRKF
jgi:thiol-disulfide isomerase/thioredoxin/uncharacterized membrane protein YphA (DoxX/SURF4 family)